MRFYFCFADFDGEPCCVVTDADLWDREAVLDDSEAADNHVPPTFSRLTESVYEYAGAREDARAALAALGMVENLALAPPCGG